MSNTDPAQALADAVFLACLNKVEMSAPEGVMISVSMPVFRRMVRYAFQEGIKWNTDRLLRDSLREDLR